MHFQSKMTLSFHSCPLLGVCDLEGGGLSFLVTAFQDVSDLFGADLPVEGGEGGCFAWRDGPLLRALKAGHWVVLDELNLASQSVLEGLNACLDHRAEVYVPELGRTFQVQPGQTRLFACQNPLHQGGGRKGLPKSFLNRFTQVSFFLKLEILMIFRCITCAVSE